MDRETIKRIQSAVVAQKEPVAAMDDRLTSPSAPINKQYQGTAAANSIVGAQIGNQIDPNWRAEQKAAEEQRIRSACLQAAAQQMPNDSTAHVIDRAKQYYDFIKGV